MKETKDIYKINEEIFYYYGYTVHKDGRIYNKKGIQLTESQYVGLHLGGKPVRISRAKLLYMLFVEDPKTRRTFFEYIDGDEININPSNLRVISQKEYFDKKGGVRKKFSKEEAQRILQSYGTPTKTQYCNQLNRVGLSFRQLAKENNCSLTTIQKIMGGTYYVDEKV